MVITGTFKHYYSYIFMSSRELNPRLTQMTVVLFEERVRIHVMLKLVVCVTTIITTFRIHKRRTIYAATSHTNCPIMSFICITHLPRIKLFVRFHRRYEQSYLVEILICFLDLKTNMGFFLWYLKVNWILFVAIWLTISLRQFVAQLRTIELLRAVALLRPISLS